MSVWLVIHDDRMWEMGDAYVCGVYASKEAAEASVVQRTPSGARSKAYGAHDEDCCGVSEWVVQTKPAKP